MLLSPTASTRVVRIPGETRPRSFAPPAGLAADTVPQFVVLGFDDNQISGLEPGERAGAMSWALDMLAQRKNPGRGGSDDPFGGRPPTASFYCSSAALNGEGPDEPARVRRVWQRALAQGHEIGNHSHSHPHGQEFSRAAWRSQISHCNRLLQRSSDADARVEPAPQGELADAGLPGLGLAADGLIGFRTPYLEYGKPTFEAVDELGFVYDCSIEDGFQPDCHGGHLPWPYTLCRGSAGHDYWVARGEREAMGQHPGLWELPAHPVIVPDDAACGDFGLQAGLRRRMATEQPSFAVEDGKITGFDYNLWAMFEMSAPEFTATLQHSLNLRLAGNRAPMLLGAHTDYYCDAWNDAPHTTGAQRRTAFEAFVDHALSHPEVRIISAAQLLTWLRQPSTAPVPPLA